MGKHWISLVVLLTATWLTAADYQVDVIPQDVGRLLPGDGTAKILIDGTTTFDLMVRHDSDYTGPSRVLVIEATDDTSVRQFMAGNVYRHEIPLSVSSPPESYQQVLVNVGNALMTAGWDDNLDRDAPYWMGMYVAAPGSSIPDPQFEVVGRMLGEDIQVKEGGTISQFLIGFIYVENLSTLPNPTFNVYPVTDSSAPHPFVVMNDPFVYQSMSIDHGALETYRYRVDIDMDPTDNALIQHRTVEVVAHGATTSMFATKVDLIRLGQPIAQQIDFMVPPLADEAIACELVVTNTTEFGQTRVESFWFAAGPNPMVRNPCLEYQYYGASWFDPVGCLDDVNSIATGGYGTIAVLGTWDDYDPTWTQSYQWRRSDPDPDITGTWTNYNMDDQDPSTWQSFPWSDAPLGLVWSVETPFGTTEYTKRYSWFEELIIPVLINPNDLQIGVAGEFGETATITVFMEEKDGYAYRGFSIGTGYEFPSFGANGIMLPVAGPAIYEMPPGQTYMDVTIPLPSIEDINTSLGVTQAMESPRVFAKGHWGPTGTGSNFLSDYGQPAQVSYSGTIYELVKGVTPGQGLHKSFDLSLRLHEFDHAVVDVRTGDTNFDFFEEHDRIFPDSLGWVWSAQFGGNTYYWYGATPSWHNDPTEPAPFVLAPSGGSGDAFTDQWSWTHSEVDFEGEIIPRGPGALFAIWKDTFFVDPSTSLSVDSVRVTVHGVMTDSSDGMEYEDSIEFEIKLEGSLITKLVIVENGQEKTLTEYKLSSIPLGTTLRLETDVESTTEPEIYFNLFRKSSGQALISGCNVPFSDYFTVTAHQENLDQDQALEWTFDLVGQVNFQTLLANQSLGHFALMGSLSDTDGCSLEDGFPQVLFVINPDEGFVIRQHLRDHIGTSEQSRSFAVNAGAIATSLEGSIALGMTNQSQSCQDCLTLFPEWPENSFHSPFGERLNLSGGATDEPRYTDHEFDMSTGLNYMKGRFQLPEYGKFNRPDPQRDWNWSSPQTINLYEYVSNNPVDSNDPTGMAQNDLQLQHMDPQKYRELTDLSALQDRSDQTVLKMAVSGGMQVRNIVNIGIQSSAESMKFYANPIGYVFQRAKTSYESGKTVPDKVSTLVDFYAEPNRADRLESIASSMSLEDGNAVITQIAGGAFMIRAFYGLKSKSRAGNNTPSIGPKKGESGGPGAGKDFPERVKNQARVESGHRCVFCKVKTIRSKTPHPQRSNVDHAIPKSRNGNNSPANAQNTCQTCNLKKGAQTTEEFLRSH